MDTLEAQIASIQEKIEALVARNKVYQERYEILNEEVEALRSENKRLKGRLASMQIEATEQNKAHRRERDLNAKYTKRIEQQLHQFIQQLRQEFKDWQQEADHGRTD